MSKFAIMTSSAHMPSSCKGRYANVAVVEYEGETLPKMISERAKGMVRIVWHSGPCNVGRTARSAYGRALAYANETIEGLK